jgi:two-component system, chemotaxis family, protein-glutamate methylesterase/glutaminase
MPIRLLAVDDSPFFLDLLGGIVSREPDIRLVGTAADGSEAVRQTLALSPDLITMDVEMPVMDGLAALERIMAVKPTPVIMVSAHTRESSVATIRALQRGAADFIAKPERALRESYGVLRAQLLEKVRAIAAAAGHRNAPEGRSASPSLPARSPRVIVLGSSTGGAPALTRICGSLPRRLKPSVVAVQHMPAIFIRELAASITAKTGVPVTIPENGELVEPGVFYLAVGGCHLAVYGDTFRITRGDAVNGHRPSVDVTMVSIARRYGAEVCGVLMTGIGNDGAMGIAAIKDAGGFTMAQDEATSVVFGMPRAAISTGKVDAVLSLEDICDCVGMMAGK